MRHDRIATSPNGIKFIERDDEPDEEEFMNKCKVCNDDLSFSWTDTHGVGQCFTCGVPYRIFHYDEEHKRVDKPPELAVLEEYISLLIEYWNETQSRIPSGHSFPGGQELASHAERVQFSEWMHAHKPQQHA